MSTLTSISMAVQRRRHRSAEARVLLVRGDSSRQSSNAHGEVKRAARGECESLPARWCGNLDRAGRLSQSIQGLDAVEQEEAGETKRDRNTAIRINSPRRVLASRRAGVRSSKVKAKKRSIIRSRLFKVSCRIMAVLRHDYNGRSAFKLVGIDLDPDPARPAQTLFHALLPCAAHRHFRCQ